MSRRVLCQTVRRRECQFTLRARLVVYAPDVRDVWLPGAERHIAALAIDGMPPSDVSDQQPLSGEVFAARRTVECLHKRRQYKIWILTNIERH